MERIGLELNFLLAAQKCVARQRIDFADLLVGHGVAAARRAIAVDHQERAVAIVRPVIGVGESGIDGEIVIRVGIHQPGRERIKALGGLAIAFLDLRSEIARPAADRIHLEQRIAPAGILLPDFEFRFLLEDADEERRVLRHVFLLKRRQHLRRQFLHRPAGDVIALFAKAAAKRQGRGEHRRRHSARTICARTGVARFKWTLPDGWNIPMPSLPNRYLLVVAFARQLNVPETYAPGIMKR